MRRLLSLPTLAFLAACGNADASPEGASAAAQGSDPQLPSIIVYKTATCGCCSGWVEHMRQAGFAVDARDVPGNVELTSVKLDAGVPMDLSSCHTSIVDGYVIEGHVPADQVKRLLAERPAVVGVAAPGMPGGSPGMDIPNSPPFDVVAWNQDGTRSVYAEITQR
jgi:hypothetical protein